MNRNIAAIALWIAGCGGGGANQAVVGQFCQADHDWQVDVYTTAPATEVSLDLLGEITLLEEAALPGSIPPCILDAGLFEDQPAAYRYTASGLDLGACGEDASATANAVRVTWEKDNGTDLSGSFCE